MTPAHPLQFIRAYLDMSRDAFEFLVARLAVRGVAISFTERVSEILRQVHWQAYAREPWSSTVNVHAEGLRSAQELGPENEIRRRMSYQASDAAMSAVWPHSEHCFGKTDSQHWDPKQNRQKYISWNHIWYSVTWSKVVSYHPCCRYDEHKTSAN